MLIPRELPRSLIPKDKKNFDFPQAIRAVGLLHPPWSHIRVEILRRGVQKALTSAKDRFPQQLIRVEVQAVSHVVEMRAARGRIRRVEEVRLLYARSTYGRMGNKKAVETRCSSLGYPNNEELG